MATTPSLFPGHIIFLDAKFSIWAGFLNTYHHHRRRRRRYNHHAHEGLGLFPVP